MWFAKQIIVCLLVHSMIVAESVMLFLLNYNTLLHVLLLSGSKVLSDCS